MRKQLIITAGVVALAGCGSAAAKPPSPASSQGAVAASSHEAVCARVAHSLRLFSREIKDTSHSLSAQMATTTAFGPMWHSEFRSEARAAGPGELRVTLARIAADATLMKTSAESGNVAFLASSTKAMTHQITRVGSECG